MYLIMVKWYGVFSIINCKRSGHLADNVDGSLWNSKEMLVNYNGSEKFQTIALQQFRIVTLRVYNGFSGAVGGNVRTSATYVR